MSSRPAQLRGTRQHASAAAVRRRRAAARRRRWFVGLLVVALCALGVKLVAPTFHTAVRDLGSLPLAHEQVIRRQAAQKRLDPALIAGVIYAESKFSDAQSSAGALGLMQLLPSTAHFIAQRTGGSAFTTEDLSTPDVNIAYGSWYLRYLLDRYNENEVLALAAYNGGETNVNKWIAQARDNGTAFTLGDIPFPETRAYVEKVMGAQHDYRRTHAKQLGLEGG
ncbi:MAG: Lytic transglycosylase catalytic [Conexibacter sp.]|nr:Lytic transglycosylase catalytic [Conexibacter sp.]